MKLYAKSLLYVLLAIAGVLVTALTDNVVTTPELVNVGIIGVGAVGIYVVPNAPEGAARFMKTAVAFVVAALVALASFLTDGITTSEWLQIAVAAFAGIGVYIIPNEPTRKSTHAELVQFNVPRGLPGVSVVDADHATAEFLRRDLREN